MNKLFIEEETDNYHLIGVNLYSGKTPEEVADKIILPFTPKTRENFKTDSAYQNYVNNVMPNKKKEWQDYRESFIKSLKEIPLDKILNEECGEVFSNISYF